MSTCWTILLTDPIDFSIVDLCEMIDIPFFRKRTDDAAFKRGHMYKVNSNEPSRFSVTSIKQTTLSKGPRATCKRLDFDSVGCSPDINNLLLAYQLCAWRDGLSDMDDLVE